MEWKTSKELKKELHNFVLKTADDLILELNERRKKWEMKTNEKVLCTK
jgi:hypothetical protein